MASELIQFGWVLMPLQAERDTNNSLRFFLTLPQGEVTPFSIGATKLDISSAEQLLAAVKSRMAEDVAKKIMSGLPKLQTLWPNGSDGDTKPYTVKRPKAGTASSLPRWRSSHLQRPDTCADLREGGGHPLVCSSH